MPKDHGYGLKEFLRMLKIKMKLRLQMHISKPKTLGEKHIKGFPNRQKMNCSSLTKWKTYGKNATKSLEKG